MGKAGRAQRRAQARAERKAAEALPLAAASWLGRVLALAGDGDSAAAVDKVAVFSRFVLLHGAARSWLWLAVDPQHDARLDPALLVVSAVALTIAFALSLLPDWSRVAPRVALPALVLQLGLTFPLTDNHFFVELLAVLVLSVVDRDGDCRPALQALLWVTALVLFHTGLQKVLYGQYVHGDFLAFMIGRGGRFADLFAVLVSGDEVARLQGYSPVRIGEGPYRVDSLALVGVSNAIYLLELTLAPLLLVKSTRTIAACAAILLVATIQLGAREVGFALLFSNLLLLFVDGDWNRRLFPLMVAIYLWALGAGWGLLPGGGLISPTSL